MPTNDFRHILKRWKKRFQKNGLRFFVGVTLLPTRLWHFSFSKKLVIIQIFFLHLQASVTAAPMEIDFDVMLKVKG